MRHVLELAARCRLEAPAGGPLDDAGWWQLATLAVEQRCAPLVLRSVDARAPEAAVAKLRTETVDAVALAEVRFGTLRGALSALGSIDAVVLKGAAYAGPLYGEPHLRPMTDVDLLVEPAAAREAVHRLERAGFRPAKGARGGIYEDPGYHERCLTDGRVVVEVHRGFAQGARARFDVPALLARRVPAPDLGPNAHRLAWDDALVYHCFHQALHEYAHPFVSYVDLREMLRRGFADVGRARVLAERQRVARPLGVSLRLAARFWPELRRHADAAPPLSPVTRAALARFVERPGARLAAPSSRAEQLWRKAWLIDSPARALRFAAWQAGSHARAFARSLGAPLAGGWA